MSEKRWLIVEGQPIKEKDACHTKTASVFVCLFQR
jgi:hypothetical protein